MTLKFHYALIIKIINIKKKHIYPISNISNYIE